MSYWLPRLTSKNALRIIVLGVFSALVGCGDYFDPSSSQSASTTAQQSATPRDLPPGDFDVVANYEAQCLTCHGPGSASPDTALIQEQWDSVETLTAALEAHPVLEDGNTLDCTGECASATASYMIDTLNLPILYVNQGQALYIEQCAACHGAQGEGGSGGPLLLDTCNSCGSLEELIQRTTDTMPPQDIGLCVGTCAVETSRFIKANYIEVAAPTGGEDQPPADNPPVDNPPAEDPPGGDPVDVPGVDPGLGGTLTCDDAGKATVFAETVYPNVLRPKCGLCHASSIANGSLFVMSNIVDENYPLFVQAADPLYDVNGEPLLLVRAVNDDGGHAGGQVFLRDSIDYTTTAAMIQAIPAEGDACATPFRTLYESFGLPFPGMVSAQ